MAYVDAIVLSLLEPVSFLPAPMAPKIYTSPFADVALQRRSVFTHLFVSQDPTLIGGYPASDVAYVDAPTGTSLTRAEVKALALQLGYTLRHHPDLGLRRGDTALIYSHNSLSWPIALFGSVAAGVKCTLANSAYNADELAFQYTDSGSRLVYTSEEGLPVVLEMLKKLGVKDWQVTSRVVVLGTNLHWAGAPSAPVPEAVKGFLTLADLLAYPGALLEEEKFDGALSNETVYLCYSSGTTGKPKGVETTHYNITSLLTQARPIMPLYPTDKMLGILPFYHVYGAVKLVHLPFTMGTPMYIMPRFDPVQFLTNIQKYKITYSLIVPPVLVTLNRHPDVEKFDLSSLQVLFSGAAPLGAALTQEVQKRLKDGPMKGKDLRIIQGYGLTETSPTTNIVPRAEGGRKVGSIGPLVPNLQARLVVDGDGDGNIDAEEGQPGELWIRGPTVMKGYHNNPAATRDAITKDGWFKTGDIAVRDKDGFYFIVDRRKELIKYKGFQVPPAELESVLLTHPDIADAAVIGVESAKEATELPRAYITHARPESLQSQAQKDAFSRSVQAWIQSKVARHKYLRGGVVVVEAIPKSAAGKLLRRQLREQAKAELAGRDPADDIIRSKL